MLYLEFGKVTIWYRLLVTQALVLLNPHQHTSVASGPIKKCCSSQNSTTLRNFPGMVWWSHDNYLYFEVKGTPFSKAIFHHLPASIVEMRVVKPEALTVITSLLTCEHSSGGPSLQQQTSYFIYTIKKCVKTRVFHWNSAVSASRSFMGTYTIWCLFQSEGLEANSLFM